MVRCRIASLATLIALAAWAAAAGASPEWISLGDAPSGTPPLVQVGVTEQEVSVDLTLSGLYADLVEVDGGSYTMLTVPECGLAGATGEPELPFRQVLVPIPNGPRLGALGVTTEPVTVLENVTVIPAGAPQPDCGSGPGLPRTCDPKAYAEDRLFPAQVARLADEVVVRGQRFLVIEIAPVQYNPADRTVVAQRHVAVRVSLDGPVDQGAEQLKLRRAKPFFATALDAPLPVDAFTNPTGVEYLVIAHDTMLASVEPLATWKRLGGLTVEVVPISAVGATSAQIKSYLQARYNADPDLTYVLLVGDHAQVPSESQGGHVSDLYYSCLDGGDIMADVVLGRLSVQTPQQAADVVDKIVNYERTPDQGTWHNEFLMAAYLQDYNDHNCTADRWFFETGTHIMHFLRDTVGLGISTAATSDNLSCNPYRWRVDSYPHRPAGYSGSTVPPADVALITTASVSTQDVTDAINAGVTLVQHRDHGGETGWGDPPYGNGNVNGLTNGAKTPVVFSTNCLTGAFDYGGGDCFAEAFLKKYPGGAVGIVAATEISYSGYNDLLAHGTWDGFYNDYDTADGGNLYPNSFRPAVSTLYGKYYMYRWEGSGSLTEYQFEIFHWFGDPDLDVYTDIPANPVVTLDPTFPVGSTAMTVTCDVEGATVAVTDSGVLLGRATVTGGAAVVTLDPPPDQPTELDVVITGHNLVPWEGSVTVIVPQGPWLVHRGHLLDDTSGGDGDGIVNPGETVVMAVTVENVGAEAGTGLAGTLTTASAHCTVTDPSAAFPDLGVNAQGASLPDHFAFAVGAAASNGESIPFTLSWTAAPSYAGDTSFSVPVCEHLVISDVTVTGITEQSAVVTWTTNVPATSRVTYGASSPPALVVEGTGLATSHSLTVTGLDGCTQYYFAVTSSTPGCYEATDDLGGAFHRFTTGAGTAVNVTATDTPVSIPDNNPTGGSSYVTVDSPWPVSDVNLLVSITHTYDGDIELFLVGPDGTQVTLASRIGGSGDNYTNTLFDDEAATPISSGSAPFTGSFQPQQPLSAFDGLPSSGQWRFWVVDRAGYDVGSITAFQLQLVVAEPCDFPLFADDFEDCTCNAWTLMVP